MDAELLRLVEERLTDSGYQNTPWAMLVLAACEGADSLDKVLGGETRRRRSKSAAKTDQNAEPPGAYLRSISVEGFRGVGPQKTLELTPGPGLTLVIGRNGSGKSSFAEALEILLTRSNWRWAFRSVIWKEGWRNLHHPSPVVVGAEFAIEGEKGATTISRTWADNGELDSSTLRVGRTTDARPWRKSPRLLTFSWTYGVLPS
ncbi:MAG: AAA family ATPase [Candidatus Limnocylindrales bacterium]